MSVRRNRGKAMPRLTSKFGAAAVAASILLTSSIAKADIIFCNKFQHLVYVAVAYPQQDGSWISRGWLNINTGDCAQFDSAIHVKTFYYRGETETYRQGRKSIKSVRAGSDGQFAIWENGNFNFWNAQTKVLNSTLTGFTKAGEVSGEAISARVTFEADGIHTTTVVDSSP